MNSRCQVMIILLPSIYRRPPHKAGCRKKAVFFRVGWFWDHRAGQKLPVDSLYMGPDSCLPPQNRLYPKVRDSSAFHSARNQRCQPLVQQQIQGICWLSDYINFSLLNNYDICTIPIKITKIATGKRITCKEQINLYNRVCFVVILVSVQHL